MPAHVAGRLARPDRRAPGDLCPIDRTMQVVGTRSAMLLLREAWYGTTPFDDFATRVGLSDAITSARLRELAAAGLLERQPYREPGQRTRHEYVLTESGTELVPVLIGLAAWGSKHAPRDWSPVATHAGCGAEITVEVRCGAGHEVAPDDVLVTG